MLQENFIQRKSGCEQSLLNAENGLGTDDIHNLLDMAEKSHQEYLIKANKQALDKALLCYREAIRINPSIADAHYKLASILWEKGDIDINSAIAKCKRAVELDSNSFNARLYLGYFLKAAGRRDEAQSAFKAAIKLSGFKSSRARLALGMSFVESIQETGISHLKAILALKYLLSGVLFSCFDYSLLKTLYNSGAEDFYLKWYSILGDFHRRMGDFTKTYSAYQKGAVKTGRKDIFYSKMGDALSELENPKHAADFYRQALSSAQDNVVLWAKLAETLQMFDRNNIEEIIFCYNKIAALEPMNPDLFYELGHLYLRKEDKFSAVNAFKRAIEINPKNAFYHNSLAYALVQLQDYDGAISEYQYAIRLNPDNEWTSIVSQALGAIYHQIKDNMDAAILSYQAAIALDTRNVDAYIALGEAYQEKNDIDGAIDCYCSAISLDPEIPKLYCNLGLLLWEKGYANEAVIAYNKAVNINPKYEIAFNNMGVVYLDGLNSPEEALIMLTQAIKINPNYALAYYNKGRAYHKLENKASAARYYQMAIDLNRLTDEFDEAEARDYLYSLFAV